MAIESVAVSERRRLFVLGPVAMLRRRTRAWWWALDTKNNHSKSVVKRTIALSVLFAVLFALTLGTTQIRVEVRFTARVLGSNGVEPRNIQIDRTIGPFNEYRAEQVASIPTSQLGDGFKSKKTGATYHAEFKRIPLLEESIHSLAIVLFWLIPSWGVPSLLLYSRAKQLAKGSPSYPIRSVTTALNYESPRILYMFLALFATWPIEILVVWIWPFVRPSSYFLMIVTGLCIAYNAVAWAQMLRSDRSRVLELSRRRVAFYSIVYGVILPGLIYGAYYTLVINYHLV